MSWKEVDVWEMPDDDSVKRERPPESLPTEDTPDDHLIDNAVKIQAEHIVRGMEVSR